MTGRSSRRWVGDGLAGSLVSPLGLAFILAVLQGCSPLPNTLWPSIQPASSRDTSAMAGHAPTTATGLLPTNAWELAGGLGLILGCGGLGVVLWKGAMVQRRVQALQDSVETLARHRDSGTADLVQLSRQVSDLNQQVRSLKAELKDRPLQPQAPARVPAPAPAPAPRRVAVAPPAAPAPTLPARLQPQAVGLPPIVSPPPPPPPPQAMPAPRPSAAPGAPAQPGAAAVAARPVQPAPVPAPEPVLARALDVLRQAALETSPPAMPEPAPSVSAPSASSSSGITLQDLIDAVNGRGNRQIEGVSFAQLDPADFDSDDGIGLPQAPRLRLVGAGGRFLMVSFEDDSWLFPAVTTLETYRHDHSDVGYYRFEPAAVTIAQLSRAAQLREAGGLWEVIEPGLILVPMV